MTNQKAVEARKMASMIAPKGFEEVSRPFYLPTLDNQIRVALYDLLHELADRIEELEDQDPR